MEISIRKWVHDDLAQIQQAWLAYYRNVARSDMHLKSDSENAMMDWLRQRFRQSSSFGFIAQQGTIPAGFLIGRIDDWDSAPPVIMPRRIGIIEAVYVSEEFRRRGIAKRLIERAIETMRAANAVAVETTYDAWNDASVETWGRAGFAPWMVHAYRLLG